MQNHSRRRVTLMLLMAIVKCTMLSAISRTLAQSPPLDEKLADIKQASAANKRALAHYTWLEQQTISLKGNVKKTQQFQVRISPHGQQQKPELNPQPAAPQPSGGRVRQHIVEKKTDEFEAYGQQIATLGKQSSQPDMQAFQHAHQQGNISVQPNSAAGTVSLIKSYLKPNDSVTLVFNQQQKAIQSIQVASYLTDPAVTIAVQFAKLPDGTNHVATNQVNGVSKQLGVSIQNSTYQPI